MWLKIAALVLLFLGEVFSIGAELIGSKRIALDSTNWISLYVGMFLVITVAGALLIAGYMLGYLQFKNIWIVTAISIGSILIVEPLLAYLVFHQTPTFGATIGLILGFLGIVATLVL
jgi:hypothetical protein